MRKILVLLLVLLLSITAISENHIYYYEMKDTVIAGTLKMEEIHDPPGYNKGEIIYPYILYLENFVDVLPIFPKQPRKLKEKNVNLIPEYDVIKIQLKFDSLKMDLKNYKDKRVMITGTLYHSDSLYFYTDVFINVDNIQVISDIEKF